MDIICTEEQLRTVQIGSQIVDEPLEAVDVLRQGTLRCRVIDEDHTVIVKHGRRPDDEPWRREAWQAVPFLTEVACLRFLGNQGPGLLGVDLDKGVLVMPDLGVAAGLDPALLGKSSEAATSGLIRWARAVGQLHAATAGQRARYDALRWALGPPHESPLLGRLPPLLEALGELGLPTPEDELRHALDPAPRDDDVLLHRDPCPDNVVLQGRVATLVDFEFSAFGPAGHDAAFLRMGMPTCWCAGMVPDTVLDAAEAAYREVASVGLPDLADDDAWTAALSEGSAHHLAMTLVWHLIPCLKSDTTWGEATNRQRIMARLERFVPGARWPGIQLLVDGLRSILDRRWGHVSLALYPAYRSA